MDHFLIPMPDFNDEVSGPLCEALMLAFSWDEDQAMRQAHLQWEHSQEPQQPPPQEPPAGDQAGEEQQPDNLVKAALSKKKTIGNFDEDMLPLSVIPSRSSKYALNKLNSGECYGIGGPPILFPSHETLKCTLRRLA